jgi:hypothetical protein
MWIRIWSMVPIWALIACTGCCFGPTVDTVPWWKGLPAMLIEPTSLEGMVWRDHLRAKHGRTGAPTDCQSVVDEGDWNDAESLELVPVPEVIDDSLQYPAEITGSDDLPEPMVE